jgi:sugar fermentation stimulation protein A
MLGVLRRNAKVLFSPANRATRRLPFTLELVQVDRFWVGVNTLVPNRLLHLAWKIGRLPEAQGYDNMRREAQVGASRLDAVFYGPMGRLWVEAKNVTLVEYDVAYFPDAVTVRGQKHLRELIALARQGERAACFYLIQRQDAHCFAPADFIDPDFAGLFWEAIEAGVEVWPYQAIVTHEGIGLGRRLALLGP